MNPRGLHVTMILGCLAPLATAQTNFPFAAPVILDIGFSQFPHSVDVGDLDEDGFIDLVVSGRNNDGIVVIFYGGPAGFEPPASLLADGQTNWAAVHDLDGDGHLDLAISNRQGRGRLSIILGEGSRRIPAAMTVRTGREPTTVRVGDLDGDGDPDLASFNWRTADVSVLHNNGLGSFTLVQEVPVNRTASSLSPPTWAELTDIDGDGDLDIAIVGLFTHGLYQLIRNRGDGLFDVAVQHALGGLDTDETLASLTAGDLDGDGDTDLVTKVGSADFIDRLIMLENDGAGVFTTRRVVPLGPVTGGSPWEMTTADFDLDGHVDLGWSTHALSTRSAVLLRNGASNDFNFDQPEQDFFLDGFPRAVKAADLDGDSDIDFVVADIANHRVAVFENLLVQGVAAPFGPPGERRRGSWTGPPRRPAVATLAGWGGEIPANPQNAVDGGGGGFGECTDGTGPCFEAHEGRGCEDEACCNTVCDIDTFCCDRQWDVECAEIADQSCEPPPVCPGDESCFQPHDEPGCDDPACCVLLCAIDGYCCFASWDRLCVEETLQLCRRPACSLGACPIEAIEEPESIECFARTNDGCNMREPAFTPVSCGDIVCGTAWTTGARDTDWYRITLTEPATLGWRVNAEFPTELFLVEGTCETSFSIIAEAFGLPCQPTTLSMAVEPGTYVLYVAPGLDVGAINSGLGCIDSKGELVGGGAYGPRYMAQVTCGPGCDADLSGDGSVGVLDLLALVAAWGLAVEGPPDLDGDGLVGGRDLSLLLGVWGRCAP